MFRVATTRTFPQIRCMHGSPFCRNLVGPPDPVSNLRPVIYDDVPPAPPDPRHPYSLKEFTGDIREYQWKMQRQELDAYNQEFWTDNNARYTAAKEAVLESLPEGSSLEEKERALSEFYRGWLAQESQRQATYNSEWRRRNWESISLGARLQYQKLVSRIARPFTSSSGIHDEKKDH